MANTVSRILINQSCVGFMTRKIVQAQEKPGKFFPTEWSNKCTLVEMALILSKLQETIPSLKVQIFFNDTTIKFDREILLDEK